LASDKSQIVMCNKLTMYIYSYNNQVVNVIIITSKNLMTSCYLQTMFAQPSC